MHAWEEIDAVFRLAERQVWIVTAAAGERRGGLAATFVMQASVDRAAPMLVAGLAANHYTAELIASSGAFAAHLITADQLDLVWRFGLNSGRDHDKLAGLSTTVSAAGAPILTQCRSWLDCRVVTRYDTGDRWYFWAEVIAAGQPGSGRPLVDADVFAAASPEQLAALKAGLAADVTLQRPLREAWLARVKP
jgi:flavin reductase (DIM6/NTAB) family NADH-FMN oxidoreductase RutF